MTLRGSPLGTPDYPPLDIYTFKPFLLGVFCLSQPSLNLMDSASKVVLLSRRAWRRESGGLARRRVLLLSGPLHLVGRSQT